MDIFEDAEAYPRRTIQQDEEEAALPHAPEDTEVPPVIWNQRLRAQLFPDGIIVNKLVVACHHTGCALLNHMLPNKQVLGSLLLPDQSMKGNAALPEPPRVNDPHCIIYVATDPSTSTSHQHSLLVSCQYRLRPERARAVCKALMGEVCPEQVVILGSMKAEEYRGPGDPSQESLVFHLHTNNPGVSPPVTGLPPLLPTGNAVGGLQAALLSYCQVRGMQAHLVLVVEMISAMSPLVVTPLAAALNALLSTSAPGLCADSTAVAAAAAELSKLAAVHSSALGNTYL